MLRPGCTFLHSDRHTTDTTERVFHALSRHLTDKRRAVRRAE